MPRYEFECKKCRHVYDIWSSMAEKEENVKKGKCPECKSKKKTEIMGCPNFMFSNPVGTDRWNSDSSGHDYRFKHNLPNVINQRQKAEEQSHMGSGSEIYNNINDLDNNDAWGEVK